MNMRSIRKNVLLVGKQVEAVVQVTKITVITMTVLRHIQTTMV